MLSSNQINYMEYVALDATDGALESKPYAPEGKLRPTQLLMSNGGQGPNLAPHMKSFGYTVDVYDNGWIGVSGEPTNTEAVRELESRRAQENLDWVRNTATESDLSQITRRF